MTINKKSLRRDDLIWGGYSLYQDPKGFCFSLDAVLLAAFTPVEPGLKVLDAATGNGVLPLLLLAREPKLAVTAIEINPDAAELARYNLKINGVEARVVTGDMMESHKVWEEGTFQRITANPPYYKKGSVRLSPHRGKNLAKVELAWDSPTFFHQCHRLLTPEGIGVTCCLKQRREENREAAEKAGLYLESAAEIRTHEGKEPYLVLNRWVKKYCNNPRVELLTLYRGDGAETPEFKEILKERAWRY